MERVFTKNTTLIKHLEISTIDHEENEELCSHLSNLEDKVKELSNRSITHIKFIGQ